MPLDCVLLARERVPFLTGNAAVSFLILFPEISFVGMGTFQMSSPLALYMEQQAIQTCLYLPLSVHTALLSFQVTNSDSIFGPPVASHSSRTFFS